MARTNTKLTGVESVKDLFFYATHYGRDFDASLQGLKRSEEFDAILAAAPETAARCEQLQAQVNRLRAVLGMLVALEDRIEENDITTDYDVKQRRIFITAARAALEQTKEDGQ